METILVEAFKLLLGEVREAVGGEFRNFKPLIDLKTTLDAINPLIMQQLAELNKALKPLITEFLGKNGKEVSLPEDVPEKIKEQMENGRVLISQLGHVGPLKCITKCRYTPKLAKLDDSLKQLLENLKIQDSWFVRMSLLVGVNNANKVAELDGFLRSTLIDILLMEVETQIMKEMLLVVLKNAQKLAGVEESNIKQMEKLKVSVKGGDVNGEVLKMAKENTQQLVQLKGSIKRQLSTLCPELADQHQTSVEVDEDRSKITQETIDETIEVVREENGKTKEVAQETADKTNEVTETLVPPVSNTTAETTPKPAQYNGLIAGGAALRLAFVVLYEVVSDIRCKTVMFKSLLTDIKFSLDSLKPLIEDMERYNKALDLSMNELETFKKQLENGVKLILNVSKISWINTYKKYKYAIKLTDLAKSLNRLLAVLSTQRVMAENSSTLVLARHIEEYVNRIDAKPNQSTIKDWCAVPQLPQLVAGLDVPLEDLKVKLLKDEVSILVLIAPGGCGKTILATMFCQDQLVKDKFKDNIFFVTVSKTPNLKHIVQDLYRRKGSPAPDFQNEEMAVKWLQQFLREAGKDPLLLVLDDVWSGSEFLIQNFSDFKMPNYKILVTSRFEFQGLGSSYRLKYVLNGEDAMTLFHYSASLGDSSSHVPEALAKQIVELCKGFPLALTVVGRSLRGKPIESWRKRISEWSKGSSSILDSETQLLPCLQSSLDALDEKEPIIKECFKDLGSFPEDTRISAAALIDMWAELYDLDEEFLSMANLMELCSRSLADLIVTRKEEMDRDGYYSENFVTQHDLLRELAVYNAKLDPVNQRRKVFIDTCGGNLPKWLMEQESQPISAHLLSVSSGEFPSKWPDMTLPEVKVLVLNCKTTKNYVLPEFVRKMDKLKALIVTNDGPFPAELNAFELLCSLSNLRRIRLEGIDVPSITKNPIQFKSLQKLSLFKCSIGQGFNNFSTPIPDAFPKLEEINIDCCDDLVELPADICGLIHLKKLSITNCDKLSALPMEIGKLLNLQVLWLWSCRNLLELPGSITKLDKLTLLDISDCVRIELLPEGIGEMTSLRKLTMRRCSGLQEYPLSLIDLKELQLVGSV